MVQLALYSVDLGSIEFALSLSFQCSHSFFFTAQLLLVDSRLILILEYCNMATLSLSGTFLSTGSNMVSTTGPIYYVLAEIAVSNGL